MSEPKRLDFEAKAGPRPNVCGGALLRLSDEDLRELKRSGVRFDSTVKHDERWTARTACSGFAKLGQALCFGCCELERQVREAFAARSQ